MVDIIKTPVNKPNVRVMYDYWLVYAYEGKVYSVRINATFPHDYRFLVKVARDMTYEELKQLSASQIK